MTPGAILAFFLVLTAICIVGNLWFHFVEALLSRIKRLFPRKDPPAWHPLPQEDARSDTDPHP